MPLKVVPESLEHFQKGKPVQDGMVVYIGEGNVCYGSLVGSSNDRDRTSAHSGPPVKRGEETITPFPYVDTCVAGHPHIADLLLMAVNIAGLVEGGI